MADSHTEASSTQPSLPIEVIEKVLEEAWVGDLSPKERARLIHSTTLVSHAFKLLMRRITTKNAYLSPTGNATTSGDVLQDQTISLTYQFPVRKIRSFYGRPIRDLLSVFRSLSYLESLRRLSIEYSGLLEGQRSRLPWHFRIVHLEVEYRIPRKVPYWLVEAICQPEAPNSTCSSWILPRFEYLSTSEGRRDYHLNKALSMCPHLEWSRYSIQATILSSSEPITENTILVHGPLKPIQNSTKMTTGEWHQKCWQTKGRSMALVLEALDSADPSFSRQPKATQALPASRALYILVPIGASSFH